MSTEVANQDQPQEQAQKEPVEAPAENGDSNSKVQEGSEEVKSKLAEKEDQTASEPSTEPQSAAEETTCSPLEEKIIRQVEVRLPIETLFRNLILPHFYYNYKNFFTLVLFWRQEFA